MSTTGGRPPAQNAGVTFEAIRVSASQAILDRAYGKAPTSQHQRPVSSSAPST